MATQSGCGGGCSSETTEPYALRVIGDSMEPEFKDGNIIIVDPAHWLVSGAYVVIDYGGEVILGQYVEEGSRKWLKYLNADHEPVELFPPYEIKGVVIQRVGRRRKERKHYEYERPRVGAIPVAVN
jgi:DNA polymerase V